MKSTDLLLITDMQNVYKKGGKWECLDTEGSAERIKNLINHFEKNHNSNIIFTEFIANSRAKGIWRNYNVKYSDVNNDVYANQIVQELKPYLDKYPCYTKDKYSSLCNKKVLKACKKASAKGGRVVLTGVVAECCVLFTAMALIDEGIYCIYLTDAVSGLDKPKEEATELVFKGLSPLHIQMMTVEEYLKNNESSN